MLHPTPNNHNVKGNITVLGVDLEKSSFQLHGIDDKGNVVLKKKLTRSKLIDFITNLPLCLIGLEACGGMHHWVRAFSEFGHRVNMIAPQFVKPYLITHKFPQL